LPDRDFTGPPSTAQPGPVDGELIFTNEIGHIGGEVIRGGASLLLRGRTGKGVSGLTDPSVLVNWFLSEAQLSSKRGGTFHFEWRGGYKMDGRVLQYVRNKSVTFLWSDKLPSGKTVETVAGFRVVPKGSGSLLKLRHVGFTVPQRFAECASRWAYYLTNMKSVLDHGTDLRSEMDW
jgi:uncharacterized protein YndB with AHSA1/START domain